MRPYSWSNLFYLLSALVFAKRFFLELFHGHVFDKAVWIAPVHLLPPGSYGEYKLYGALVTVGFLLLAAFPMRASAFLGALLWAIALSLNNSFGNMVHSMHGYFLAAFGMCVATLLGDDRRSMNYAMGAMGAMYASAAIWKIESVWGQSDMIHWAASCLPHHIAYGMAENTPPLGYSLLKFFNAHYYVSALSWFAVIAFQLLVPFTLLFAWRGRAFGLFALIAFHQLGRWGLGPNFLVQIMLLSLFLGVEIYTRRGRLAPV